MAALGVHQYSNGLSATPEERQQLGAWTDPVLASAVAAAKAP